MLPRPWLPGAPPPPAPGAGWQWLSSRRHAPEARSEAPRADPFAPARVRPRSTPAPDGRRLFLVRLAPGALGPLPVVPQERSLLRYPPYLSAESTPGVASCRCRGCRRTRWSVPTAQPAGAPAPTPALPASGPARRIRCRRSRTRRSQRRHGRCQGVGRPRARASQACPRSPRGAAPSDAETLPPPGPAAACTRPIATSA
mmetsp:Transcript_6308/g.17616  ORF Transcript_6308/g.17616 Transcript_6308/m.17616 type:complete len:200 (+) Transcript_6308:286-885(+)